MKWNVASARNAAVHAHRGGRMGGAGMFDADPVSSWGSGDFSGGAAFFVFALVAAALSRWALHSHGGPSHAPQGLLVALEASVNPELS